AFLTERKRARTESIARRGDAIQGEPQGAGQGFGGTQSIFYRKST
ncbi:hypothetical protein HMPREF1548_00716, partial [Clostridium sp. KLE 1755]